MAEYKMTWNEATNTMYFTCGGCGSSFSVNAGGYAHLYYDCPTCGETCGIHRAPGWEPETAEVKEEGASDVQP